MSKPFEAGAGALQPVDALLEVAHHARVQAWCAEEQTEAARNAHDTEVVAFLEEVRQQSLDIAERCKSLLAERLGRSPERSAQQRVEEASEESFPASDAPAY